jgi:hypothetical protein
MDTALRCGPFLRLRHWRGAMLRRLPNRRVYCFLKPRPAIRPKLDFRIYPWLLRLCHDDRRR